jgi:hypothetical protein
MRRFLPGILCLLAGCGGLMGPRKHDRDPQKVDSPNLTIKEQEYRARDRLPYSEPGVGPRTWTEVPSEQYGRTSH